MLNDHIGNILPTSEPAQNAPTKNLYAAYEESLNPVELHEALQPDADNLECPVLTNNSSYRLGAEDEINIKVFGEDDLTGNYRIQNSGIVNIPLIGETKFSGCTLRQAENLLYAKFSDGYLVDPSISLSVIKYRPFYILGEVREPGRYDYVVNMNVLQAVALAGGFTYRANRKEAKTLTGKENDNPVYKNIKVENQIHPGDVIFVKERFF